MDDYEMLGLKAGADLPAVKKAWGRLRVSEHPDKHANSDASVERYKQISTAYQRLEAHLSRVPVEVPLRVLLHGGSVRFRHSGASFRLTVPRHTVPGTTLAAFDSDDRRQDVVVKPLVPEGWSLDETVVGSLVHELLVTWLAAYRGDTLLAIGPLGEEVTVRLNPGADTGQFNDVPGLGLPLPGGRRGPARWRLRLVPPPPGSLILIDALEAPWG